MPLPKLLMHKQCIHQIVPCRTVYVLYHYTFCERSAVYFYFCDLATNKYQLCYYVQVNLLPDG